jgi:hypothetical protein
VRGNANATISIFKFMPDGTLPQTHAAHWVWILNLFFKVSTNQGGMLKSEFPANTL